MGTIGLYLDSSDGAHYLGSTLALPTAAELEVAAAVLERPDAQLVAVGGDGRESWVWDPGAHRWRAG
jgi:hypothetical protein